MGIYVENLLTFYIQSGKSIECTVDPASLKATVKIPSGSKRGCAYWLDILKIVLKWWNFCLYLTLKHSHADNHRPVKLFTHGFRDSTKETEATYFVPGEFFEKIDNFVELLPTLVKSTYKSPTSVDGEIRGPARRSPS